MSIPIDITNKIELLKTYSSTEISNLQAGKVPEFIKAQPRLADYYMYNNKQYAPTSTTQAIISVTQLKYKKSTATKSNLTFIKRLKDAVDTNQIHPFLLFINNKFVKWSNIQIVKDFRYNYILVDGFTQNMVKKIDILHIPFSVYYSENRIIPNGYTCIFRFSPEGTLSSTSFTTISTISSEIKYRTESFLDGFIKQHDLGLNSIYKLDSKNVVLFKDDILCTDIKAEVENMNLLTVNDGEPVNTRITYKMFYNNTTNRSINNINIPIRDDIIKSLLKKDTTMRDLDLDVINNTFDFGFTRDKFYKNNIIDSILYINRYNPMLLDSIHEERSTIKTKVYRGYEINAIKDKNGFATFLRLKYNDYDTFVMIFLNGELLKYHNSIEYIANRFKFYVGDINDGDFLEIVYFRNVNNTVVESKYYRGFGVLERPIDKKNLQVLSNHYYSRSAKNLVINPNLDVSINKIERPWDKNLHKDAFTPLAWSDGYNSEVTDPLVGYHAKFVHEEGIDGSSCLKFMDYNMQFGNPHRWLGASTNITNFQHEDKPGKITISVYAKTNNIKKHLMCLVKPIDGITNKEVGSREIHFTKENEWERFSYTFDIESFDLLEIEIFVYGHYHHASDILSGEGIIWVDKVMVEIDDEPFPIFIENPIEEQAKMYEIDYNETLYPAKFSFFNGDELYLDRSYDKKDIVLCSKRQFRYVRYNISEATIRVSLPHYFKTCLNIDQYMVFLNGRLVSIDSLKIIRPDIDNPFPGVFIYLKKMLLQNDVLDIFYVPVPNKYLDLGNDTQVKVVKNKAVFDQQPSIEIPIEFENIDLFKQNFFIIIDSVFIDQDRYDVIDNMLIFKEERDYLPYNKEVFFVYMIANANFTNDAFVEKLNEDDYLNVKQVTIKATEDVQKEFDIPFPFVGFNGVYLVTSKGLLISSDRFIESSGKIIFKDDNDGIQKDVNIIFNFIYTDKMEITYDKLLLYSTFDNQREFDFIEPFENYLKNGNTFLVMQNGIFLNKGQYAVNREDKKIVLTSPDLSGLDSGLELTVLVPFSFNESINTNIKQIAATQDKQMEFDIPLEFNDEMISSKVFVTVGSTMINNFSYDIKNRKLKFKDINDAVQNGRTVSFIFFSKQPVIRDAINIYNSRYTNFFTGFVNIDEDGQTEFDIPFEDCTTKEIEFIVSMGSVFLSDDMYYVDIIRNKLIFYDGSSMVAGRKLTFSFLSNRFSNVAKDTMFARATVDNQIEFEIPLPYENFLNLGNEFMLFIGTTFVDPETYVIDKVKNIITFIGDRGVGLGRMLTFVFIYTPSTNNTSSYNPNAYTFVLREYGYIFVGLNTEDIGLPYPKTKRKNYFLFINGKKVDVDNIEKISANFIRIKRDIQTRNNVCILDYTEQIEELKIGTDLISYWDKVLNNLALSDIDLLMDITGILSNTDIKFSENIDNHTISNEMIREFYMSPQFIDGDGKIFSEDSKYYPELDDSGNLLIPNRIASEKTGYIKSTDTATDVDDSER